MQTDIWLTTKPRKNAPSIRAYENKEDGSRMLPAFQHGSSGASKGSQHLQFATNSIIMLNCLPKIYLVTSDSHFLTLRAQQVCFK